MKILLLALANLKKRKSSSITLFLLVLLAALMLNTGLSIFTRLSSFLLDKTAELNGAHFVANLANDDNFQKKLDFLSDYPYIDKLEKEESIFLNGAEIPFGKGIQTTFLIVLNADTPRTISPLKLVEKLDSTSPDAIYLPYIFKSGGGYSLGDTITISLADKKHVYKVGGFFEDTTLGHTMLGSVKAFLTGDALTELNKSYAEDNKGVLLSLRLTDITKVVDLSKELDRKFLVGIYNQTITSDVITSDMNYTMPLKLIASLLIAFAIIVIAVALIVVRFRVSNSIEDDMPNIGSLKAVGYTSSQILLSIIVQFLVISIMAGILGIMISYMIMPTLGGIISASAGLVWTSSPEIPINLISVFTVVILVSFITMATASRVRKISPIAALRGGIETHSFKRNFFPLEKLNLNLQILIGLKNTANSMKQNAFILVIIALLCFASIFCSVIYYNFGVDKANMYSIVGSEQCNVIIQVKPGVDTTDMFAEISKMEEVRTIGMLSAQAAVINNDAIFMYVSDDYSKIIWNNVYKGRQPEYDNEIAISGMIAKKMNKKIGDTIEVSYGDTSKNFLITGLSQQISNAGRIAAVTLEGYKKINPEYKKDELSIYLKEKNASEFMDKVKDRYSQQIFVIGDLDAAAESQLGAITNALFSIMILIIIMSAAVISLILYLLIKTIISKRRREFGIFKANGYTTLQLMSQITFSFIPVVGLGSLIGGIMSFYFTNSALSLLLSSLGFYNSKFTVNLTSVVVICLGMVLAAYAISMLVAYKVRKITAYGLITE